MVSIHEIKTIILNHKKVFAKARYEPNDVVWWVDNIKIKGMVINVRGYYCHIVDEYNNEYIKPHLELFLDEANLIQSLINDMALLKKDIHNIKINLEQIQKTTIKNYENTAFTIPPLYSKL
jgi:hypothetical protein